MGVAVWGRASACLAVLLGKRDGRLTPPDYVRVIEGNFEKIMNEGWVMAISQALGAPLGLGALYLVAT